MVRFALKEKYFQCHGHSNSTKIIIVQALFVLVQTFILFNDFVTTSEKRFSQTHNNLIGCVLLAHVLFHFQPTKSS